MSVVAWDGATVASDCQGTQNDLRLKVTKIFRLDSGTIVAFVGDIEKGLALKKWFEEGEDPNKWPSFQADKESWSRLMVFPVREKPFVFEQLPVRQPVEDKFAAWGNGRDFALGAMAHGASAVTAVKIASELCVTCGHGFIAFTVR